MNWNLPFGEFLKARLESENEFHKSAVAVKKSILWLDIYQKEKLVNSQKLFCFFFVEAIKTFAFEVTGKRVKTLAIRKDSKYLVNCILLDMQNTLRS